MGAQNSTPIIEAKNSKIYTWTDRRGNVYAVNSIPCRNCHYHKIMSDRTDFNDGDYGDYGACTITHEWDHCCECGVNYPKNRCIKKFFGLSIQCIEDDLTYDHCCLCRVYFTDRQQHCCECKSVFQTSHKCKGIKS